MIGVRKVNRRNFLKTGVASAAGLTLTFALPERLAAQTPGAVAKLNGYVHIGSNDAITFVLTKSEMGQGPLTSLSKPRRCQVGFTGVNGLRALKISLPSCVWISP